MFNVLNQYQHLKLGKPFEFDGSTTHETLTLSVVKCLKAVIDMQTEVLSKIYRILEGTFNTHSNSRQSLHSLWWHDQLKQQPTSSISLQDGSDFKLLILRKKDVAGDQFTPTNLNFIAPFCGVTTLYAFIIHHLGYQ
ncbi:hypothetical protein P692DRAFT_20821983 [Suillus brevipes Sb2]|nr:hypothetical protein P692DRAFT_20821983 [Suillus brevipes Sb2]